MCYFTGCIFMFSCLSSLFSVSFCFILIKDSVTAAESEPDHHLRSRRLQEAPCLQVDRDNRQSFLYHLKHKHKRYTTSAVKEQNQ